MLPEEAVCRALQPNLITNVIEFLHPHPRNSDRCKQRLPIIKRLRCVCETNQAQTVNFYTTSTAACYAARATGSDLSHQDLSH
uniref:uncharacterized protein LOC120953708 n=1 Tax=Anopheles coluzzii TaxID=1518534 RepID=UPI0020FF965F|nr:uncharacterized protein LOC120953708 [Anopheles coluzzii]